MAPHSAKPLERVPGTLFEREELPSADIADGCLRSLIIAADRLEAILGELPAGTHGRGLLLEQARIATERLSKALGEARARQLAHAWRQS